MRHEELGALAAVYAVGALDGDDLAHFEAHLGSRCERCTAALRELDETLTRLALEVMPVLPPPATRATLLRRAGRLASLRRGLRAAAAIAAAVVVGAALTGMWVAARYEAFLGGMARDTAAVRTRVLASETELREQVAAYRATAELLRDPATRVIELRGVGTAAGASARIVWQAHVGGRLFAAQLPAPPPGETYELWAIGDTPRALGTLDVDTAGAASRAIEPTHDAVRTFAVTLEREGGAEVPIGPMVLVAK